MIVPKNESPSDRRERELRIVENPTTKCPNCFVSNKDFNFGGYCDTCFNEIYSNGFED